MEKINEEEVKKMVLEERKVRSLEKTGNVLSALTIWFEEINKDEWGKRNEWYLSKFKELIIDKNINRIKK
jgi:hypothetical protein